MDVCCTHLQVTHHRNWRVMAFDLLEHDLLEHGIDENRLKQCTELSAVSAVQLVRT